MKIRGKRLIRLLAWLGSWIIRLWMRTLRYEYHPLGANADPNQPGLAIRYMYTFWHENLLLPAYLFGRSDIYILISQHADGELISEICRHLRFQTIRGSTTRGGVEAVRQMLRAGEDAHLAITPDGPRGPRRKVQAGLVYLAARTGVPIVPVGICYSRCWRMRSWDRFAIPKPWAFGAYVTDPPITIPVDADRATLEQYRLQLEASIERVTVMAEQWATTGIRPGKIDAVKPGGEELRAAG